MLIIEFAFNQLNKNFCKFSDEGSNCWIYALYLLTVFAMLAIFDYLLCR